MKKDLENFNQDLTDLCKKYTDKIEPCEMIHSLCSISVSMSFFCAGEGREILAIKTILASVENGIKEYENSK